MKNTTIISLNKNIFLSFVCVVAFFTSSFGQIQIEEYPRKLKMPMSEIKEYPIPVAHSNCDSLTSNVKEEIFSGGQNGTLVRTVTYTDKCDQTSEAQQYFNIESERIQLKVIPQADVPNTRKK